MQEILAPAGSLSIIHRWPTLIAFTLIGCLVGWGVSLFYPPFYRATASLYVGLNPYRAFNDTTFLALANPDYTNIDDYNNWQMSQLNAAIYLDEIIQTTLDRLQERDDAGVQLAQGATQEAASRMANCWRMELIAEDRRPIGHPHKMGRPERINTG
jgi:hypothetical protein